MDHSDKVRLVAEAMANMCNNGFYCPIQGHREECPAYWCCGMATTEDWIKFIDDDSEKKNEEI